MDGWPVTESYNDWYGRSTCHCPFAAVIQATVSEYTCTLVACDTCGTVYLFSEWAGRFDHA